LTFYGPVKSYNNEINKEASDTILKHVSAVSPKGLYAENSQGDGFLSLLRIAV